MGQSFGAHANFDAGCHAGLAAVNGRHTQAGKPLPPGTVGQDHGLRNDQVERRAPLTYANLNGLISDRRRVIAFTR